MRDARERVVGSVDFVLDFKLDGMLHAKAVRSPLPHARIVNIDVSHASQMPGVRKVLTGADLARDDRINVFFGAQKADQPVLAIDKVRYAGEPLALVIAETPRQAADAVPFVDVEYEELPYVVSEEESALPAAPVIHEDSPDNSVARWRISQGDVETGFAQADHIFRTSYYSPPASHVPMEPFVCVAQWKPGELDIWSSAQAPHAVREGLEKMFSMPAGGVRVRTMNLGGGYGAKGQIRIEPMVACAALAVGEPVRMELARDEVFQTIGKHAASIRLETGVTNDGKIISRKTYVNYNAGAYAVTSVFGAGQGVSRANGPYRIPNVLIDSVATYTNSVPSGPHRGAMTTQLAFAYESQMDDIAAALGIDPLEIRRINLLREGDPYPTGECLEDLHYDDLLDDLEAAIAWDQPSEKPGTGRVRGKGVAIIIKNTITPSRSEARLRINLDGSVDVFSSSVEMGQGSNATLVQIAAEALGVEPGRVTMGFPDTAITPFDTTTSSSRTTFSMGRAIGEACQDLREQAAKLAAGIWGIDANQVEVCDGVVRAEDGSTAALGWAELLKASGETELVGHGVFQSDFGLPYMDRLDVKGPVSVHWHQGGAAAEVEVDLETGHVTVLHVHANCYAGRVINAHRVKQQNQGSVCFSLGPTMFEEMVYQDGALTNPNLSDYMIPSIMDVPPKITTTAIESGDPDAELHGVGEMPDPAIAPAIANAIFAATGARITTLPLSPERVLRALDDRDRSAESAGKG
jgi:CO/xanthine dehydrogenase Mo-binding subunit